LCEFAVYNVPVEVVKISVLFAAPEPRKFVNFFFNFSNVLRRVGLKYAQSLVENLLNKHKKRSVLLVMRIGFDELRDVDCLAYLDEFIQGCVFYNYNRKHISARE